MRGKQRSRDKRRSLSRMPRFLVFFFAKEVFGISFAELCEEVCFLICECRIVVIQVEELFGKVCVLE